MNELRSKLEELIQSAMTDEAVKSATTKMHNAMAELQSEFEYHLQSDLAYNLARHVQAMAEDAIKAMLNGDDEIMRRHLQCRANGYTGRDSRHPVIRGKLFETGAIELRKAVVNAHANLLKNERILDLEDQVRSLVDQFNKLERDNENLRRSEVSA